MGQGVNTHKITTGQTFRIVASMNIFAMSYRMSTTTGDAGTVNGNVTIKDENGIDVPSTPNTIDAGEVGVFVSQASQQPLNGYTFTCTQGTLKFYLTQQ